MVPFFKLAALTLNEARNAGMELCEDIHLCEVSLHCAATDNTVTPSGDEEDAEDRQHFSETLLEELAKALKEDLKCRDWAEKEPESFV